MSTLALVESPAQLVNVVEWTHQVARRADPQASPTIVILAPVTENTRLQLRTMAVIAREAGCEVQWHEPRLGGASTARTVRSLAGLLAGVERLIIGDPFSGVMQVVIGVARVPEVVIIDDGTATIEFARQWTAGEHLARWDSVATPRQRQQIKTFARQQIAGSVRRRLSPGSGTKVSLFTCMPVDLPQFPLIRNDFSWLRSLYPQPSLKINSDLIGTSLVESGVVEVGAYLSAVSQLAAQHSVDRYFAHRKEAEAKLAAVEQLGLTVIRPDLPLELVARAGPIGPTMISFPSSVIHTLPVVLADTATRLLVCDIEDAWFTSDAPRDSHRFLGSVTRTARQRHGVGSIAAAV